MPIEAKVIATEKDFAYLSPREILSYCLERNIKFVREEKIPLNRVRTDPDETIVDEEHADDLSDSIEEWGQLTPIGTRIQVDEETDSLVYDIFDGFHRTDGEKRRGKSTIRSTVIYGCTDEELYDLRILAANSVRSVQFARQAKWISKVFSLSKWADCGLTVSQIFGIAANDRATSYLIKRPPEELQELKDWAKEKARKWDKPVASIYQLLRIVENADPELVKQVRTAGGLKDRSGRITQDRLASVVEVFPVQTHRAAQRAVLKFAVEKRLYAEQVSALARRMAHVITPEMDEDAIISLLQKLSDWDLVRLTNSTIGPSFLTESREQPEEESNFPDEFGETFDDPEKPIFDASIHGDGHKPQLTSEELDLLEIDEEQKPESSDKTKINFSGSKSARYQEGSLGADSSRLKALTEENATLRAALKAVQGGENVVDLKLLIDSAVLPPKEGEVLRRLFLEYQDLSQVCREMGISVGQLILLVQSAFRRYSFEGKPLESTNASFTERAEDDLTSLW